MRLGTIQTADGARVVAVTGVADQPKFFDLCSVDSSLPGCLRGLLTAEDGLTRAAAALTKGEHDGTFIEGTWLAPIPEPQKVICIGLNYRDHAEESGLPIPEEPVCFSKFSHCVIGTGASIELPAVAKKVDYEAELVAVIGKRGRCIAQADALSYVAGYMNGHDVSARDWQIGRPGGQWLLGKTPDTFAPVGPYLVTADEVADPHNLGVKLRLNGDVMQDGNTKEFIFKIDELIAHLSQLITLEPGDLIFTGTPPGVGAARKPPVFLKPGDVVEVEIEGLGVLRNPVIAAP